MERTMPTMCASERVPILPRVEQRAERHYLSILACVAPDDILAALPGLWRDVMVHCATRGKTHSGPRFVRHVITRSDDRIELEAGVPVCVPISGDRRIRTSTMPAGTYAVVPCDGGWPHLRDAQDALLAWGSECEVEWDSWPIPEGIAWGGRIATFSTSRRLAASARAGGGEIAFRIRGAAASLSRSSHQFTLPSMNDQVSSQNDFGLEPVRHGSRR